MWEDSDKCELHLLDMRCLPLKDKEVELNVIMNQAQYIFFHIDNRFDETTRISSTSLTQGKT